MMEVDGSMLDEMCCAVVIIPVSSQSAIAAMTSFHPSGPPKIEWRLANSWGYDVWVALVFYCITTGKNKRCGCGGEV